MRQNTDGTGWVDPISIRFDDQGFYFFLIYNQNDCNGLYAVTPSGKTVLVAFDQPASGEAVCIQSLVFASQNYIYFYASTPHKSYERHVYRVAYDSLVVGLDWTVQSFNQWQCITCVTEARVIRLQPFLVIFYIRRQKIQNNPKCLYYGNILVPNFYQFNC